MLKDSINSSGGTGTMTYRSARFWSDHGLGDKFMFALVLLLLLRSSLLSAGWTDWQWRGRIEGVLQGLVLGPEGIVIRILDQIQIVRKQNTK